MEKFYYAKSPEGLSPEEIREALLNRSAPAPAPVAAPVQPAAPAAPPRPKFCPGCGAPADGGKFCQNCGTRLG